MKICLLILINLALSSAYASEVACPVGQYFVKAHTRRAHLRGGKYVGPTFVRAHCKIKTNAFEYFDKRIKNAAPANWPHKKEIFKKWTADDVQTVIDALEQLPEGLLVNSIDGIYRASKSREFPNPATSADRILVLYDSAFKENAPLSRIVAHELAHQVYIDLSTRQKRDYWFTMNWLPIDPNANRFYSRKEGYIQDDGREGPDEDFANNLEFYLFDSKKLQKVSPHAYRWIKANFGDSFRLREGL